MEAKCAPAGWLIKARRAGWRACRRLRGAVAGPLNQPARVPGTARSISCPPPLILVALASVGWQVRQSAAGLY